MMQSARTPHAHPHRDLVRAGAVLLDVRTREEFAAEHVPGAVNIPVQELPARITELGSPARKVVVYCRSGGRSATAAFLLKRAGYEVHDVGPMTAY